MYRTTLAKIAGCMLLLWGSAFSQNGHAEFWLPYNGQTLTIPSGSNYIFQYDGYLFIQPSSPPGR